MNVFALSLLVASALQYELVDLNKVLFEQYMLEHDTTLYAETAHPDYLLLVGIGIVETREEVLATASNLEMASVTVTNEHFIHHGDTAVLIGRLDVDGNVMGNKLPAQIRYMSVFVSDDDGWRLLSRSLTHVNLPPGFEE